MRRRFETRWGAAPVEGGARFALWAPHEETVSVLDPVSGRAEPMHDAGAGWKRLETGLIAPDAPYCFALADGTRVPDPAARAQAGDVLGPSRLVDPEAFDWRSDWAGRPWEEAVVYELHVGTFTPEGTFDAAADKLPLLAETGVTVVELMPVAQFAGNRGWGYDGVLLYAPHRAYGGPEGLKRLVDRAHGLGLSVILDVVYNHFGPEGNFLPRYAPGFFHPERRTPWGDAIAFDAAPVRTFYVENALYWLEEFRLDGFRFDAIDQIDDPSETHILEEIAATIRARVTDRPIHLTTEDERNIVGLHPRDAEGRPTLHTAEWNDDFHHLAHVAATGEAEGYYRDYQGDHGARLARVLASGFDFQGRRSEHWGRDRGEPSGGQPPTAFVNFIQNHDQTGNRAFGERLTVLAEPQAVETLTAILLLAPATPLIFMGEEWGETRPFLFFADFDGPLAEAVRKGRRAEFADWGDFSDPARREAIPDPCEAGTFAASRLDWRGRESAAGRARLGLVRGLLALRAAEIAPRLGGLRDGSAEGEALSEHAARVHWRLDDGAALTLVANIAGEAGPAAGRPEGRVLHETEAGLADALGAGRPLPRWSALWTLAP